MASVPSWHWAFELDVNTAFACMEATQKPIGVSFTRPEHLEAAIAMFDAALGSEGGEAAIAGAAAAQLLRHVGLPSTVSAGMILKAPLARV